MHIIQYVMIITKYYFLFFFFFLVYIHYYTCWIYIPIIPIPFYSSSFLVFIIINIKSSIIIYIYCKYNT